MLMTRRNSRVLHMRRSSGNDITHCIIGNSHSNVWRSTWRGGLWKISLCVVLIILSSPVNGADGAGSEVSQAPASDNLKSPALDTQKGGGSSEAKVNTVESDVSPAVETTQIKATDAGPAAANTQEESQKHDKDSKENPKLPEAPGEGGEMTDGAEEHRPMPGISSDAILRGFYVFVGIGTIVLLYIVIKLLRLRRRRATRKYRVLSQHTDDQEMFPLAADDGDDEEIYNAADHQTVK